MGVPQWIVVGSHLIALGVVLAKHGQPRDGDYNAWLSALVTAAYFGVLWWGGFFG